MKEFTSQVGGRYTYIDDILNLQELSLAIVSLFDGCDNFIISGCQIFGTTLTPGYVYINGKIRYCAGTTGVNTWPIYIYERNTVEKVSYADSGDKVGRNVYGCAVGISVPTSADLLTGAIPQFIKMANGGVTMRLKDAFFGKYALTIDSAYNSQSVNKSMVLGGDLTVNGIVQSNTALQTVSGNNKGIVSYNSLGDLVVQSTATGRNAYQIVITNDGAFKFYSGNTLLATLTSSGFVASVPFATTTLSAGTIRCGSSDIYNNGTATDAGAIQLNMLGYGGGHSYYRDTIIGNGKNSAVLTITGKTRQCTLSGDLVISSSNAAAFKLVHSSLAKSDKTLQSYINWLDKNGDTIATLGYTSNTDSDLYIKNNLGSVRVENDMYVTRRLYVDGIDIMSVLVGKGDISSALSGKANVSDVYSKLAADSTFIKRTDSINVFVDSAGGGEAGRKSIRDSIGAASVRDLSGIVQKSLLFKDIVSEGLPAVSDDGYVTALVSRQRTLCENIGAVYKDDAQVAQKDTGWVAVDMKNCAISTLYVRQVGHMVCIQGELHTHHSGTIFTLPNTIDPPKYKIGQSYYKGGEWNCYIAAGSRNCVVDTCNNGCSEYIGFLMTYIV